MLRKTDSCPDECFVKSLVEGLSNTKALTCGFHLRSKADICASDLLEGEYRHLDCEVLCFFLKSRCVTKLFDLMSKDNSCCKRNDRDSCYLADVRYCTAGTRVNLDHIYILAYNDELNIDHTDNMKCLCKTTCVFGDGIFCFLADGLCRIYGNTVSGVDTCTLDMLHDSRDQNVLAITNRIYLDLFSHQILIYQDRMLLCDLVDDADVFFHILITDCNTHPLAAQNIGRTNQYRIPKLVCRLFRFLCSKYRMTLWSWDLAFFKDLIEQLPILCSIYILRRSSQDLHTHFGKGFCQLNGCLTAKLYHSSIRFFNVYHILHIFRSQRFKIQLICNIKVCTYCFRIVIYNDGLIAFFCKCPGTMYRAEVKLNTLANTDRS